MSETVDILWVLVCTALVFIMQAGFLMLESGFTRNKNNINVAMKNIADFALSTLLFWAFGFALMFGASAGGWVGLTEFAPEIDPQRVSLMVFFAFQVMFCGTAVTIVSGAIAERMRFNAYMVISALVGGLTYPIFGHWAWNGVDIGLPGGWLNSLGFVDFAGSSVVHSVGGWVSLALLLLIGPRIGRFDAQGRPQKIPASNLIIATTGVMLLWFGWLGFNGGSALALNEQAVRAVLNTVMAGSAGLVAGMLLGYVVYRQYDVNLLLNGTLAGLVGITANAHVVSLTSSVIIGALAAVVMYGVQVLLERLHIDDAVGAVPVHLGAGIWGTLAVGLFGDLSLINNGLTRLDQIGVQVLGIVACGIWIFGTTYAVAVLLNRVIPLRVSPEDEKIGLNISEHNEHSDLFDLFSAMDTQAQTGDLNLRVPVEPFTEIGLIADRYNGVIRSLQQAEGEKQHVRELQLKSELALENSRLKSEFLSTISHELRTPLNALIGYSGLLLMGVRGKIDQEAREIIQSLEQSGKHLLTLINDVLDIDKIESGQFRLSSHPLEVRPLVKQWIDHVNVLAEQKGLAINTVIADDFPPMVMGDGERLTQIALNLLSNAIKFTDKGAVWLTVRRGHDRWCIEVKDSGIGISHADQQIIFEKFRQADGSTSRAYGGTGLGLAITQQLVVAMGGEISVQSAPREGSLFSVTLPLIFPN